MKQNVDGDSTKVYGVSVELSFPELHPQAVMYSLFDHDPLDEFRANVKAMSARGVLGQDSKVDRVGLIHVAWDLLFNKTPGHEVYLAVPREEPEEVLDPDTGKVTLRMTMTGIFIGTTEATPVLRRWVVTRTCMHDGRPLAWCIPVAISIGSRQDVRLTQDGAIDLLSTYRTR